MIAYVEAVPAESKKNPCDDCLYGGSSRRISKRIRPIIMWRQFPPNLKKESMWWLLLWRQFPPNLKENTCADFLCGSSSHRISKRICPIIMWRQFLLNLKKNLPQNYVIMLRQFPPNLKKNPPQNYVEAVPTKSQKESALKLCWGRSRRISKRIHPKIMLRQFLLNLKKESAPTLCGGSSCRISKRFCPKIKNKTVPTKSQKESNPKLHGGSSCQISKRICPKIMCRQFSPNLK